MPQYKLEYNAVNTYGKEVWGAYLKFLIHPYSALGVQVNFPIFNTSVPGNWWLSNARQKEVSEIYFNTNGRFKTMEISYSVEVGVPELNPFDRIFLSEEEEISMMQSNNWLVDNYQYIHLSPHRLKTFLSAEESRKFKWSEKGYLIDKIIHLRDQVHTQLDFVPEVTTVSTTAREVLKLGEGVCQDFSHVFLALLRNNGVAARYVSGYLYNGENIRGASQLHAWVECHIPGSGWIGIDPANKLLVDHNYIKICHGYDYDDCKPVAGVINTSASDQSSTYQVNVQQIQ
ncbi:MAG: transglutaminase-like domain-containing protein [Flavobacteriales bacterium]